MRINEVNNSDSNYFLDILSYDHEDPNSLDYLYGSKVKYARILEISDINTIKKLAGKIRQRFEEESARLGIQDSITRFGEQDTWIYWDIAKQIFYFINQLDGKSDDEYNIGNPLENTDIQQDIIDRHLGWEILHLFNGEKVKDDSAAEIFFDVANKINNQDADRNIKLGKEAQHISSHRFTEIGRRIRERGMKIQLFTEEDYANIAMNALDGQ